MHPRAKTPLLFHSFHLIQTNVFNHLKQLHSFKTTYSILHSFQNTDSTHFTQFKWIISMIFEKNDFIRLEQHISLVYSTLLYKIRFHLFDSIQTNNFNYFQQKWFHSFHKIDCTRFSQLKMNNFNHIQNTVISLI